MPGNFPHLWNIKDAFIATKKWMSRLINSVDVKNGFIADIKCIIISHV